MKKTIVLTLLMLVAPAMGAVELQCVVDSSLLTISYDANSETELVRAFALDVNVVGASIASVVSVNPKYYIYPGTIIIDANGDVSDYGTPVAPANDPGALGGLPGPACTLELGSLYEEGDDGNAPDKSGFLISLSLSGMSPTGVVSVTTNETRGRIVMEDSTSRDANCVCGWEPNEPNECFPSNHPDYNEWVAVGKPPCWCYPRQCQGDADGLEEGKNNYWVAGGDLAILRNAWNKPLANLVGNEICADFAHDAEGKNDYRVSGSDLAILRDNWQISNGPDPNCGIP